MLELTIPMQEVFDESEDRFVVTQASVIHLEHSLVSISKWEAEFEKPFLETENKTAEEILAYVKFMTLTPNVSDLVFNNLTEKNIEAINKYVSKKMTATWFKNQLSSRGGNSGSLITSEIIYYWMISHNIPLECETWHLERLMTLIRVVNEKNKPPKKMSRQEAIAQQRSLNAQRRQAAGSRG